MAGLFIRLRMFFSSYVPLFAILALRFDGVVLRSVCLGLAILGALTLGLLLRSAKRTESDPHRITTVRDVGAEVAGYLASYLLPFVTTSQPSIRDIVAYGMFLGVVGTIYVQSDMLQVNPLLYLAHRRVTFITTEGGWQGYFVSRGRPRPGDVVRASRFADTLAVREEG
jgi:hypothetical protein